MCGERHTHEGDQLRKSRASSKHRAPQRTPPKHESERAAACVDAQADTAAAASVTPTRAISRARAEHRASIEHHSVRRPSMRASEQRRVSVQKLTQPQRRASHPRGRSAAQEPSIERHPAPPKHESARVGERHAHKRAISWVPEPARAISCARAWHRAPAGHIEQLSTGSSKWFPSSNSETSMGEGSIRVLHSL